MKRLFLAALLAVTVSPALAEDYGTGNIVLDFCSRAGDSGDLFCSGYVLGANQGMEALEVIAGADNFVPPCIPDGVSVAQRKDIFLKYLKQYPEERHMKGLVLYIMALRTAFPCP
jgi:hypothetical protein